MKLSDATINKECKVLKIDCKKNIKNRLEKMGLTVGVKIKVLRSAPFGDPIIVKVRGFNLALRRSVLQEITVIYD